MSEVIEIVILTFVVWIGLLGVVGPRAKRRLTVPLNGYPN